MEMPERWRCAACSVAAPDLLVLPECGHTFCMPCVDTWLWTYISESGGQGGRYPCQACGRTYQIPVDGLDAFLQNVQVRQLEAELQKLNMAEAKMTTANAVTPGISVSMAAHMVMGPTSFLDRAESDLNAGPMRIEGASMQIEDSPLRIEGVPMRMETAEPNIMRSVQAACSGEFVAIGTARCALLPYTSYCQLPNHMF